MIKDTAYIIFVRGDASRFDETLKRAFAHAFEAFGMRLDDDVAVHVGMEPIGATSGAVKLDLFFGGDDFADSSYEISDPTIPVLPVVSDISKCASELPKEVSGFNAIVYQGGSRSQAEALASVVLEVFGILPEKRRVFLSYRRDEAREIALQLHDSLRARQFSVFLDTHEIRYGGLFQDALWHQLSDCDVLLMLDTTKYFESRWTEEEFGRAGNMKIGILRVAFPGVAPAPATSLAANVNLKANDFTVDRLLTEAAVDQIGDTLERFRARSIAARLDNMLGTLRLAVEKRGGAIGNPGPLKSVSLSLPPNKLGEVAEVLVYPTTGVPTSDVVERAIKNANVECALLYDGQSLLQRWVEHLEWFAGGIDKFRWIRSDNPSQALKEFEE